MRLTCSALTFLTGWATARSIDVIRYRSHSKAAATYQHVPAPLPLLRSWPDPGCIDLDLSDAEQLTYQGHVVQRLYKSVRIEDFSQSSKSRFRNVDVSYAIARNQGKVLGRFDGTYHLMGNDTRFGLVSLLGTETKQLVVSQTIWRGGQHWIANFSPHFHVIYRSADWHLGNESISSFDLDADGVEEIAESVSSFYDLQDKLSIAQIPAPLVIFKYDNKAQKYFPANTLHRDYLLRDIQTKKLEALKSAQDKFDHLARVLDVTLSLLYAGDESEAWDFYDQAYSSTDKKEVRGRVEADLNDDPVYRFIYSNRKLKQISEIALPQGIRAALNREFPGWRYAPVDHEIRDFIKEDISPFARPDLISGDFDGNGLPDYALLIEQRKTRENKVHLVVFLGIHRGFEMHLLEPDGEYLCVMPRGEWDYDYETQSNFTYQNDAIFTGIFEKGGTSYVYERGRFRSIITSD